jgi:mRNA interferase RelE/StbE
VRAVISSRVAEQLAAAPDPIPRAFFKQLGYLLRDLHHPSLNAKKYPEGGPDIWQARITKVWRFYFKIEGDAYLITNATDHPK